MAEMQLSTSERLKLTYEMRVPQVIELLDMSEQTLQKVITASMHLHVSSAVTVDFDKIHFSLSLSKGNGGRVGGMNQCDISAFLISSVG